MAQYRVIRMLQKTFEANKEKALMTLELLTENPAGIGDHSTSDFYNNAEEAIKALEQPKHELDIVVARETNSNVDPQLFTVDVGGSPQRCYFWFCICISFILPAFYRRLVKETDAN